MRVIAILLTAAALIALCVSAHAQFIDPDTAYYAGQEEQRAIDMDRQTARLLEQAQQREQEKDRADAAQFNRDVDDFVREQQLQRMRDEPR